jgi:hypothetical protein
LLKKELSLDTYSWQKKYAHLTSSTMMAQVDERLKRRFSVSTSMEEISKIAEMKNIGSQQNIGNPEQAALAQSQHFDQLEALWNKRSPPRRRINQVSRFFRPCFSSSFSLFSHNSHFPDNHRWPRTESTRRTRTNFLKSVQVRASIILVTLNPIPMHEHATKTLF